jgi:hypothetical protein
MPRWVGHVAYVEQMRNALEMLIGKPEGEKSLDLDLGDLEDLGVYGRIILKSVLKWGVWV